MKKSPINITKKAAEEVQKIIEHKNIPEDYMLRIGVKGGGCGGASFFIAFDLPKEVDHVYQTPEGLPFVMHKGHLMYLLDITLDYEERRTEQGFIFRKPENLEVS